MVIYTDVLLPEYSNPNPSLGLYSILSSPWPGLAILDPPIKEEGKKGFLDFSHKLKHIFKHCSFLLTRGKEGGGDPTPELDICKTTSQVFWSF
jgi:hypothetical protein